MVLSGVIKIISTFIFLPLAALLLALSLFSYSASIVLTDKENAKSWLKHESVRDVLKENILESVENQRELSLITYLFGQDKVEEFIDENLKVEWTDQYIDQLVDETYVWLESDESTKDSEKTGLLGLNLTNGLNFLPKAYQILVGAYKKLFFATIFLVSIVFLTAKSFRRGFFLLGLIGVIAGGLLYFGPGYIANHQEILRNFDMFGINFKGYFELPEVYQKVIQLALGDVVSGVNHYAFIIFIAGLITAVVTQFAVNRIELDTGVEGGYSSDSNGIPTENLNSSYENLENEENYGRDLMNQNIGNGDSNADNPTASRDMRQMGRRVESNVQEKTYIRDKDGNFIEVEDK